MTASQNIGWESRINFIIRWLLRKSVSSVKTPASRITTDAKLEFRHNWSQKSFESELVCCKREIGRNHHVVPLSSRRGEQTHFDSKTSRPDLFGNSHKSIASIPIKKRLGTEQQGTSELFVVSQMLAVSQQFWRTRLQPRAKVNAYPT